MASSSKRKRDRSHSSEPPNPKRVRLATSLSNNVQNALKNKTFHDVEFVVGRNENQEIFCGSRLFYAIHSKVLENMLFGSMQESLTENQVIIPDIYPCAFRYFQSLVYSQPVSLNCDIAVHALYLAQKYLIEVLVQETQNYILNVIELTDFYKILNGFSSYPPSTFDGFLLRFLKECKLCKLKNNQNEIEKIMEHNKFMKLPVYMVQKIIKSKLIRTEQSKYIHCKEYCKINMKKDKNESENVNTWQGMFKVHFMSFIDFSRIKSDFLLSNIRNDEILTNMQLLNLWEIKTKRDKPGFKIEECYLPYDECLQLESGTFVDVRCCTGEIVQARIIEKSDSELSIDEDNENNNFLHEVCVQYNGIQNTPIQEYVSLDDNRLLIHGSVSLREHTHKSCMQNKVRIGCELFVNMQYLPSKAYGVGNLNCWIKCKVVGFGKRMKQIQVRSIGDKMDGDYYFHPDSSQEIACSLECEYCCYN